MIVPPRPRRLAAAAVSVALALALGACAQEYPNTTFSHHTEFNRAIDYLWDRLLFWGTLVFILVQIGVLFIIFRYRRRDGNAEPRQVHGNTALEITWTLIPAVILILIAVPTVRTIFATQADAPGDALQVEVIGHQWWWEFRYPQYNISTANELYLPLDRTVNFALRTADVLHSFWIPQMGGKRDLITNRTNFLWFTPDSTTANAWNGFCVEYCGASHANMKFRAFTVTPAQFDQWVALQSAPAQFGAVATPQGPPPAGAAQPPAGNVPPANAQQASTPPAGTPPAGTQRGNAPSAAPATALAAGYYAWPAEQMPAYAIPNAPIPAGLEIDSALVGDAERGRVLYSQSACIGCHRIRGATSPGILGPELTHFGSRLTLGAGMFPNDTRHLRAWIRNAQRMKPGAIMPPFGQGERDSRTGAAGTFTDQQIADIAAYLQALK